eukprot:jgi/Psemu1/53156/gm1.53156_g
MAQLGLGAMDKKPSTILNDNYGAMDKKPKNAGEVHVTEAQKLNEIKAVSTNEIKPSRPIHQEPQEHREISNIQNMADACKNISFRTTVTIDGRIIMCD